MNEHLSMLTVEVTYALLLCQKDVYVKNVDFTSSLIHTIFARKSFLEVTILVQKIECIYIVGKGVCAVEITL